MKVIICPDKFKGSLSARAVGEAIERGIKRVNPLIETVVHPLADGGEGSLHFLESKALVLVQEVKVLDALGREIKAKYFIWNNSAFIEMASASGLNQIKPHERNVMRSSSFGTGQLILHALQKGVGRIYLFIGGSATNDCGMGMAAALGYQFFDRKAEIVQPTGGDLIEVYRINSKSKSQLIEKAEIITVTDVSNPLFGPEGAAFIYAKQKGANDDEVKVLDEGLINMARVIRSDLKVSVENLKGAGAAGGMGAGTVAFLGAKIASGIQTIMELTEFEKICEGADLIISGEGRADEQTKYGKVIKGVSEIAIKHAIPLAILVGKNEMLQEDVKLMKIGYAAEIVSFSNSEADAFENAEQYLELLAQDLINNWLPLSNHD
jgi:glycerate kinase